MLVLGHLSEYVSRQRWPARTWTPTNATVSSPYVLGPGDATLDLSQVAAGQTATIVSKIGAGRLTVLVREVARCWSEPG
jgi:hypothetical protein